MAHLMASFQCYESSMTQPAMLIKVVARGRVRLMTFAFIIIGYYYAVPLFFWSQACSHSWTLFIAMVLNGDTCNKCRCICSVLGAMACWCIWLAGAEEESWQGTKIMYYALSNVFFLCSFVFKLFFFGFWVCCMFCRRRVELVIYSTAFGFLTSLWNVFKRMAPGRFSVPMKLEVWQTCGVTNLRVYLSSMRKRCNLSLSQTDVSCQDVLNFLDLNAPIQRYLTPFTLSTG